MWRYCILKSFIQNTSRQILIVTQNSCDLQFAVAHYQLRKTLAHGIFSSILKVAFVMLRENILLIKALWERRKISRISSILSKFSFYCFIWWHWWEYHLKVFLHIVWICTALVNLILMIWTQLKCSIKNLKLPKMQQQKKKKIEEKRYSTSKCYGNEI